MDEENGSQFFPIIGETSHVGDKLQVWLDP